MRSTDSVHDAELRAQLARGQHPFAVIVTCSDSRVPDNIVFDQEAGRLFTVREAGNSPDQQGIASVEYSVGHLESVLVVVMGHHKCGAVQAVREARGEPPPATCTSFSRPWPACSRARPPTPGRTRTATSCG